ncbi:hypothetical protein BXZ70DRAFT_1065024 [Cristinia sonorae]|uniref:F-box domain-containing protein n=1 Tax=Cristinia sonorae TaxID=1940300 RepID=A0A8K0UME0_9AGAR|nr:hypothetical protein BXZ70DRAFT_1065024 [Cristinia sonorae]
MLTIADLPNEILEIILLGVEVQSVVRVRQVCRKFNGLICNSISIQYRIELVIDGLEDGPPGGKSISDRLETLRSRRSAWTAMQPTYERVIEFQIPNAMNICPRIATRGHFAWVAWANDSEQAHLHILQVPSVYRGIPEKEWVIEGGVGNGDGVSFASAECVAIEPDEDLLVVVENRDGDFTPVLRSLTTGQYHPEAIESELPSMEGVEYDVVVVDVFQQYACVLFNGFWGDIKQVHLYNWKTGEILLYMEYMPAGFAFVSEQYFLIAHSNRDDVRMTLSVFDLRTFPRDDAIFMSKPSDVAIVATAQLHLPIYKGEAMQIIASSPHPRKHHANVPFYVGDNQVFVIRATLEDDQTLTLVVPWSTIQRGIRKCQEERKQSLEWGEWGPKGYSPIPEPKPELQSLPKGMSPFLRPDMTAKHLYNFERMQTLVHLARKSVTNMGVAGQKMTIGDDYIIVDQWQNQSEDGIAQSRHYHILSF